MEQRWEAHVIRLCLLRLISVGLGLSVRWTHLFAGKHVYRPAKFHHRGSRHLERTSTVPPDVRSPHNSRRQLRSKLKTYLFWQAYNTAWFLWEQFLEECNFVTVTVTVSGMRLVAQWLTDWHSGREIWGSYPGHATILLGSNLGQVVYSHCPPVFSASRNWGTNGSIRTEPI